jgi:hypothetical protein
MRQRAPIVLSITALVVAVLGATPLGQAAASRLAAVVPPFARTAGFARLSGNSNKLNNHKSTLRGLPGTIPVVGANGKLPASIGAVGPQGPAGPAGAAGAKGDRGPAGPTFGASTALGNPNSYTNMSEIGQTIDVKFDSAGTLFAFGRVQAVLTCTANQDCNRHYGLYIDGQQVEGTLVEVHNYGNVQRTDNFAIFGTKAVSAGTHTVRFRAGNTANVQGSLDVSVNVGGIALGNAAT